MCNVRKQRQMYFFYEDRIDCPFVFESFYFVGGGISVKKAAQGRGIMNLLSTFYALFCLHSMRNHSPKTVKKTNSNHLACLFLVKSYFCANNLETGQDN